MSIQVELDAIAQAVAHQTVLAGLADEFLKDAFESLFAEPLAKVRAGGVVGQLPAGGQIEEETKRDVRPRTHDDLPIREPIVKPQKEELEHQHRIDGRPPHGLVDVGVFAGFAKAFEIDHRLGLPQIMVLGNKAPKDLKIELGENHGLTRLQHHAPPQPLV